jgi:citrate synthase
MTYASGPESLQGAVAAGLLGCGSVILGSSEDTGILLRELVSRHRDGEGSLEVLAVDTVRRLRAERRQVPGIGHPLHRELDPRAEALLTLAREQGTSGEHVAAVHALVAAAQQVTGKVLPLNVSGAIPAVLLDVDFPLGAMKGVPLVGRTMSLVAHLLEEQSTPLGFRLAAAADAAVQYRDVTM